MSNDANDNKILELIKRDETISNSEISRILGIPEEEVEVRIRNFSDTRRFYSKI